MFVFRFSRGTYGRNANHRGNRRSSEKDEGHEEKTDDVKAPPSLLDLPKIAPPEDPHGPPGPGTNKVIYKYILF